MCICIRILSLVMIKCWTWLFQIDNQRLYFLELEAGQGLTCPALRTLSGTCLMDCLTWGRRMYSGVHPNLSSTCWLPVERFRMILISPCHLSKSFCVHNLNPPVAVARSVESLPSNPAARVRFPTGVRNLNFCPGIGVCPLSGFCPVLSSAEALTLCWPQVSRKRTLVYLFSVLVQRLSLPLQASDPRAFCL